MGDPNVYPLVSLDGYPISSEIVEWRQGLGWWCVKCDAIVNTDTVNSPHWTCKGHKMKMLRHARDRLQPCRTITINPSHPTFADGQRGNTRVFNRDLEEFSRRCRFFHDCVFERLAESDDDAPPQGMTVTPNGGDGDGRGQRPRRLQGHEQWRVESTPMIPERIERHYHRVTAFNAFETEMSGRVDSIPMVAERIDRLEHRVTALEQEFRDAKEFGDQLIQLQATVAMLSSLLPASSLEPREVSLHPITIR